MSQENSFRFNMQFVNISELKSSSRKMKMPTKIVSHWEVLYVNRWWHGGIATKQKSKHPN